MDEALELGGEHQEYDQQRQHEGHDDAARGLLELLRLPRPAELGLGRQRVAGEPLEIVDRLAERIAFAKRCVRVIEGSRL